MGGEEVKEVDVEEFKPDNIEQLEQVDSEVIGKAEEK